MSQKRGNIHFDKELFLARRAFEPDEIRRLLEATAAAPRRKGICKGPDLSLPSKEKQQAIATGTEDEKNLALADGKPRTSMDSDGQKAEKEVYSGTLGKNAF